MGDILAQMAADTLGRRSVSREVSTKGTVWPPSSAAFD